MFFLFIFIFGLSVGSFLNVVICRLKTKETILFNRSYCPKCRAVLKWYDLIPVLSFLLQKGRCRYCNAKISWQYPIVEISTGLLFLLIFNLQFTPFDFTQGKIFNLIYYFIIVSFLIIIFVYDLKHYIILDRIIYPGIIISLLYLLAAAAYDSLFSYFLSAFIASGFFLALVLVSEGKWMGLGDVKLSFLMGLILGWPNILFALFLSFLSGAVIGIGLIIFGKKGFKSQIPFGPFLAGSTILVMFSTLYLNNLIQNLFFFIL
ncbi:MAG: prepilin peptidase [Patescibacteria group bacterium]